MRVSQATFYLESHPGAFLQAYALQRALKTAGHDPEMIHYAPKSAHRTSLKQWISRLASSQLMTDRAYESFRKTHLKETPQHYASICELEAGLGTPNALICGSDQIWNPHLFPNGFIDPFYLLKFKGSGIRRIAYAASMGGWLPQAGGEAELRDALRGFSAISVREPSAKSLLERILKREVSLVADPTLLHASYDELCQTPVEDGDHVLLYGLQWSDLLRETVTSVSRRHKMPIVAMGGPLLPWKRIGKRVDPATPGEWIGRIRRAGIVVTNSYHGLIFSILSGKQVYVPLLANSLARRNERMEHLCDMLGISRQVIVSDAARLPEDGIDWTDVRRRIENVKQTSLGFLRSAFA